MGIKLKTAALRLQHQNNEVILEISYTHTLENHQRIINIKKLFTKRAKIGSYAYKHPNRLNNRKANQEKSRALQEKIRKSRSIS
uniref:Uncharacterized protein n=1 Tax=Timema shepardi TaxID=629360 RepID=A0A7R9AQR3_TIMSH|nr:unnamed protein product [Timema shepardi]